MRRMRDLLAFGGRNASRKIVLTCFALAVVAGAAYWGSQFAGVRSQFASAKKKFFNARENFASLLDPLRTDSQGELNARATRSLANSAEVPLAEDKTPKQKENSLETAHDKGVPIAKAHERSGKSVDEDGDDASVEAPREHNRKPASLLAVMKADENHGLCQSVEYRGEGPAKTKVSLEDWSRVMDQFHGIKDDLVAALKRQNPHLSEKTLGALESQVRGIRIQRAPTPEEPDLAWRGIGAWTYEADGKPIIRIGGGMLKLLAQQPSRGRFELARLVAQAWAPCELKRNAIDVDSKEVFEPLTQCLGVQDAHACEKGTFSEAGWAVSTAVAAAVAAPACQIPAFSEPKMAQCLSAWKEARR